MCKKANTNQKSESQNKEAISDQKLKPQNKLDNAINIAILVAVFIAAASLVITFIRFFINENTMLDEITQTLNTLGDSISNPSHSSNKMVELRMEYLDRISQMHKQASSSDLFVFMYGFLSSVLIGISAYLIKKGESQVNEINDKALGVETSVNEINDKALEVETSVDELRGKTEKANKSVDELEEKTDKVDKSVIQLKKQADNLNYLIENNSKDIRSLIDSYNTLNTDTQKVKIIIDNNKSTIMLNYMLMLLSDSLFMLINYRSSQDQDIEYLIRFNQNIKQLENISLLNVNELSSKTYIGKLMQMVGNVRSVYDLVAEDKSFSIDIDETHKSNTSKYLKQIEDWLINMLENQSSSD
jgi:hypothetical protein